jgi:hypothetical protein
VYIIDRLSFTGVLGYQTYQGIFTRGSRKAQHQPLVEVPFLFEVIMGLDIRGKKTGHHISGAYSRLHHTARYLALKWCGMPDSIGKNRQGDDVDGFGFYMHPWADDKVLNQEDLVSWMWSLELGGRYFPNILLHSDAEGNYTKNGKTAPFKAHLMGGNSIQLLKELETLCNDKDILESKNERMLNAVPYTKAFRDLVKDEIDNGCGTIEFY